MTARIARCLFPLLLATVLFAGCGDGGDPPDPRIAALWEAPHACGAPAYSWLDDPTIGTVVDWREDEMLEYTPAVLQTALAAAGFDLDLGFQHDVRLFLFRYVTQDRGALVEATSTLAVPILADGAEPQPTLVFLHGTAGFSDGCAASTNLLYPLLVAGLASVGHVVVGPDYLGMVSLGSPSDNLHPYLVVEPTALASLDAVRAGRALLPELDMGVTATDGLSVMGGSQGGHAALAVAWYAPYYAPEEEITGVAASVPPADMLGQAQRGTLEKVSATRNIMAFLAAFADWYDTPLAEVLLPPHDTAVYDHMDTECGLGGIDSGATDATEIFTPSFRALAEAGFPDDGSVWSCMLRANSFPHLSVEPLILPPTLFVLSENDELVHTPIEQGAFDALCAQGYPLQYLECAGAEHTEGALGSFPEQLEFLDARRRGDPWPEEDQCVRTAPVVCSGSQP